MADFQLTTFISNCLLLSITLNIYKKRFLTLKGYTTANEPHYNDGYFGVKSNLASSDHGKVEENLAIYVVATFLAIIIKSRWAT